MYSADKESNNNELDNNSFTLPETGIMKKKLS